MIKRSLLIFSFLIIFFTLLFQGRVPTGRVGFVVFAINSNTSTSSATTSATTTTSQPSWWDQFWSWVFGLFVKTDYTINVRTPDAIDSDMTDYGDQNQSDYQNKHSFAGSRLTDSTSQECLKGNVIKQATLGNNNYPNSDLSQICLDSSNQCVIQISDTSNPNLTQCHKINVKDLAHYFVQKQKQFYCASNNNNLIDTEQNIIDQINKDYSTNIPDNELTCYQEIYNDFYLTPKNSTDNREENTIKLMQTPISIDNQDSSFNSNQIKDQVDQNLSPANYPNSGLSGLRPAAW